MSNKSKRIVLLNEVELRETILRLTSEIIEKVKNLESLLLVGIPTRGIDLAIVLEKELFFKTGFIQVEQLELQWMLYILGEDLKELCCWLWLIGAIENYLFSLIFVVKKFQLAKVKLLVCV